MSDSNSYPPSVPPQIQIRTPGVLGPPLGEAQEDRLPVSGFIPAVESILRQPRRIIYQLRQEGPGSLIARLLVIAAVCGLIYGVVVGTFSRGDALYQFWAAPVKVSLGLLISALICLPSLYIFSCLSGSQARLVEVFGLLAGLLALTTILLIGFAPVAWVFSESTKSLPAISALHLVFWLIATYFGLRFLSRGFAHLSAETDAALKVWILIFLLVAMQMTTALRPMVGTGASFLPVEKKFFVTHWLECLARE
jgi:hypothetical protein